MGAVAAVVPVIKTVATVASAASSLIGAFGGFGGGQSAPEVPAVAPPPAPAQEAGVDPTEALKDEQRARIQRARQAQSSFGRLEEIDESKVQRKTLLGE